MTDEDLTSEELQASKAYVLGIVQDLLPGLLYYDRKNDDDLPPGRIELLVERGILTPEEIAAAFSKQVLEHFYQEDETPS